MGLAAAEGRTRCLRELFEVLPSLLLEELLQAPSTNLGLTPLSLAARGGHAKTVALLLRQNVRIGVRDKRGMDALAIAGMHGHVDVVRLLRLKEEEELAARISRASARVQERAERAARKKEKQEEKKRKEHAKRVEAEAKEEAKREENVVD